MCNGLDFIQLIDSATHGGHCLDNIFTNDWESYQSVGISAPIESLHCVTWVTLSKLVMKPPKETFRVVDWEAANWPKAQVSLIQNPDGSPRELKEIIASAPSVDEAAHILTCTIQSAQMEALSDSSAVKHVRPRRASCPFDFQRTFQEGST
ncbi:MAG: hypothetical protein GY696_03210 [Gammaproteobacteria bacterium]|nr:hypothetical protein [Gammaproteobacteria bacterium]